MDADAAPGWTGSMPDAYDQLLGPAVFQPFATDLASRLGAADEPVLELAAGSGRLTAALVARSADAAVTATDVSGAMVELGRQRVPGATWQQADATDLPFADASFGAVVCQFGLMFFPDRHQALRECWRVLRPGGALVASTWGPWEAHGFAAPLLRALDACFPDDLTAFLRTVPHGLHNVDALVGELRRAGFTEVRAGTIVRSGHAVAAEVVRGFCLGTPVRTEIEARGDLTATIEDLIGRVEDEVGTDVVRADMTAVVLEGRTPGPDQPSSGIGGVTPTS